MPVAPRRAIPKTPACPPSPSLCRAAWSPRGFRGQGGTATETNDFTYITNSVTFESGQTNAVIRIPIFDDNVVEIDEYFTITLTNAAGGATLPGGLPTSSTSTIVTIIDNDLSSGRASFTLASYVTNEFAVAAIVSVQRLGGSVGTLRVQVAATNGTAFNGVNFSGVYGMNEREQAPPDSRLLHG